jgi:pyruvate dehydrogenase (quinone)/pyruvate oxidase
MAKRIAAEDLVERLIEWGVDTVFGLPGDGINGIMEGLRRHADRIHFVLVHHEEAAAFMACAYAKVTGRIGVCLATSGPGGLHLLNGLYDAMLDHAPVLAITGMQETAVQGTGYQQEVHLDHAFADVAGFNEVVTAPVAIPALVDRAIRSALGTKGVSHLTFPNDLQVAEAGMAPYPTVSPVRPPATAPGYTGPSGLPRPDDVRRAAELLNAGEKVAMLVGQGALGARAEVLEVAEMLGAPIVKSLLGKAVVPDDHPFTTGGLGLLGTKPSEAVMSECDTLLMVGTSFPYTAHLPGPGQVKTVQIDLDPGRAGSRMPTQVPIVADAAETLRALAPLLHRKPGRGFLEDAQRTMATWREDMRALQDAGRDPIMPQHVVGELDRLASDDAILCCDSGTLTTWAARHWTIRGDRAFHVSGTLASMACGLPYALAAQWAFPGRQVLAYAGDGGFAMLMAELDTAVRYGLPIKVVVNNNAALGQIEWEQVVLGNPEHGVRFEDVAGRSRPMSFAPFAESVGALGVHVTDGGQVGEAIARALAHDGPALVDVTVNPHEPPIPGKIEFKQAKGFAEAFLRGEPDLLDTAKTVVKDQIERLRH